LLANLISNGIIEEKWKNKIIMEKKLGEKELWKL
jgi:hypothetical protein